MQLIDQTSDTLLALTKQVNTLADQLLPAWQSGHTIDTTLGEPIVIISQEAALLIEGKAQYIQQGKPICLFEPGDLLTADLANNGGHYMCAEAGQVRLMNTNQLVDQISALNNGVHTWTQYLMLQQHYFRQAYVEQARGQFKPSTGFLHFSKGEVIIEQGDSADYVYTLLEGNAEAIVEGTKVGSINADEIFGALAVFTRQPRNATVIATSHCTVMAVPKDEFMDLMEHQPRVCLSLIEEMAATINQLNQALTSNSSRS